MPVPPTPPAARGAALELELARRRFAACQQECLDLQAALAESARKLDESRIQAAAQLSALEAQAKVHRTDMAATQAHLDAVLNSVSWRITAPYRRACLWLRPRLGRARRRA